MKRREVKENHEESVLNAFRKYQESLGHTFDVVKKPEPPDALIKINGNETWVEITDAFFNKEHAISLTSAVSEDKKWEKSSGAAVDPDSFLNVLRDTVKKKVTKTSIKNIEHERGVGILIIGCFSPFHFPVLKYKAELEVCILDELSKHKKIFNEVFIYDYDYKILKIK